MRSFAAQLYWEFRKIWARPRTWFGFVAGLLWHVIASLLLCHPAIRLRIQRDMWKMRWDFDQTFSGLTTAAHLTGEAMTVIATVALAMAACDLIGQEVEDGTMRMLLCRPISRTRIYFLKVVVALAYTFLLTGFIAASGLVVGLLFEGRGPLVMIAVHENIVGTFGFEEGLQRYALAAGLVGLSALSGTLITYALSCFPIKPAAAAVIALTLFFADNCVRTFPNLPDATPYCLTTRMIAWRQVFNYEIPVERLQRCYRDLFILDAVALVVGWAAFQRRNFKA